MIHRLSELLTQYFMKYGQATDKAEVYIYGIECFISEFIGNLLLLTQTSHINFSYAP